METVSRSLLTFLLNSAWQIPLAAAVAALASSIMRRGPARNRHTVWVAALAVGILLPLASTRTPEPPSVPRFATVWPSPEVALAAPAPRMHAPAPRIHAPVREFRTVVVTETTASLLLCGFCLLILARLIALAWAAFRSVQIRRRAYACALPEQVERVRRRCEAAFGLTGVPLLFSRHVPGPLTVWRSVVLPQSLLSERSEDVLTTAIGHEMAHIARRDFGCNLLVELFCLPVSFQPAAWLIRRGIQRSREMACDELVTERLIDASRYARAMVGMAASMTALTSPGYTLGVFDGDVFEERIRRLLDGRVSGVRQSRLLLATGLSALAVCAVVASGLALTARAQSVTSVVVQKDAAARQQYLDILARDRRNQQALHGMISLCMSAKQFVEAHDWAVQAIHRDAADKTAYYAAGFADWAIAWPDYTSARQSLGMQPRDGGLISDRRLRQSLRMQHLARIEDGIRMMNTAVQLDPDFFAAMEYASLLYGMQSAVAGSEGQSADLAARAGDWNRRAEKTRSARMPEHDDTAAFRSPLPPPPPPPPGWHGSVNPPKLVREARAFIPTEVLKAVSGVVQLSVVIAKDGSVRHVDVISGPPALAGPLVEAVGKYVYEPTLVGGKPVEVTTTINVKIMSPLN